VTVSYISFCFFHVLCKNQFDDAAFLIVQNDFSDAKGKMFQHKIRFISNLDEILSLSRCDMGVACQVKVAGF